MMCLLFLDHRPVLGVAPPIGGKTEKPPERGDRLENRLANVVPKNSSGETFPNIILAIFFSCIGRYLMVQQWHRRTIPTSKRIRSCVGWFTIAEWIASGSWWPITTRRLSSSPVASIGKPITSKRCNFLFLQLPIEYLRIQTQENDTPTRG